MSLLQRLYFAYKLTQKKSISDPEKLNHTIRSANIDLNPYQVDAAIFAFKSPLSRGAILADEVGLGKTIEAGLIINQLWVEGRQHMLILVPASLRTQWQDELLNKFNLESIILDSSAFRDLQKKRKKSNPLLDNGLYIASHNFAYRNDVFVKEVAWDLVTIDEAHRMRNVWRKGNKTAKVIKETIKDRPKILLTATPLQNNLMELYGLTTFLDENYLGTDFSFKTLFINPVKRQKKYDHLAQLKERLMGTIVNGEVRGGVLTRSLRKQVKGFINFTNRHSVTEDFAPNDDEMELYNRVSDYLRRPYLASTMATQRNMMELVYRKILASSSFAIAGTLHKIVEFLSKRLQREQYMKYDDIVSIIDEVHNLSEEKFGKKLTELKIKKLADIPQDETLPGLDDIEMDLPKTEEEIQDSDDLLEDTETSAKKAPKSQREIDHKFEKEEIISELKDVLAYYYLATTIDINQKSQALMRVLKKVFEYATKKDWPQKAIIFTESRRTQDHLEKLLSGIGYELVLFNGTNASKRSHEIFEEWARNFPNEAVVGSRSINIRKALVWKFKELKNAILITTEAGAEGLNLQFANIVVNYDLPWNPQRIEQRIGRCHRYGQELDVLVINFLNKRNYADERVYQLLAEKIKLFGNLFDFSDKVLGTERISDDGYEVREVALGGLGAGIEFEKRIMSIYKNCRTQDQIKNCFQQLQFELSNIIDAKNVDTQRKVIQHFDEEVRSKLRIREKNIGDALGRFDEMLKSYIKTTFGDKISYPDDKSFTYEGKNYVFGNLNEGERAQGIIGANLNLDFIKLSIENDKNLMGNWRVIFKHRDSSGRKYFEDYIGCDGQLAVDLLICKRKTINNADEIFEKIIVSSVIYKENSWHPLNSKLAERFFDLLITGEQGDNTAICIELEKNAQENILAEKESINAENEQYVDQEMEHLDRFVEESLIKNKQDMGIREQELKELGKQLRSVSKTMGFHERQQILELRDKKQKELFKAQKNYFQTQEEQFRQKDKKISELRGKLQMVFEHRRLAQCHFKINS